MVSEDNRQYLPHRIRIEQDDTVDFDPRDWDNVGRMVCWHSRYKLGDEQPSRSADEFFRELAAEHVGAQDVDLIPEEHVARILEKYFIILPLYLFDHSGITMSTSSARFRACDSAGWDWGHVGFIYCAKERAIAECTTVEKATACMVGEVKTYAQYLEGDIWHFVMEYLDPITGDWEHTDSCGGFFGSDPQTNGMAEHLPQGAETDGSAFWVLDDDRARAIGLCAILQHVDHGRAMRLAV